MHRRLYYKTVNYITIAIITMFIVYVTLDKLVASRQDQVTSIEYVVKPKYMKTVKPTQTMTPNRNKMVLKKYKKKYYILLWTNPKYIPFKYFGEDNTVFVDKKCEWTNCYVTSDRSFLGSYTRFDVVAINGPQLSMHIFNQDLPKERSKYQKYVYANIESAQNYPVYDTNLNNYFNWTWTYKLNSDAIWGYLAIKDANNKVIGPNVDMHWMNVDDMDPIDEQFKAQLDTKSRAAVWISSHCNTGSGREDYVKKLRLHLKPFNLVVDTYGDCGDQQCSKTIMDRCLNMVRKHYYFYLAFENSFSEDYVTEKIVYALQNDVIPVVYGGANYTRFMPDDIYIDATKLTPAELARSMNEIIQNKTKYYDYFKWKKYYSYHFRDEFPETDDYCQFCKMINNRTLMNTHTSYDNFIDWWNAGKNLNQT